MSGKAKLVCFYSIATHLGGAERSLLDLVSKLEESSGGEFKPWVLLPKKDGPLWDLLRERGVETSYLPLPKPFLSMTRSRPFLSLLLAALSVLPMLFYFSRFFMLLRRRRPELLHTTGIKCHLLAYPVCKLSGIRLVWHLRDILTTGPLQKTFELIARAESVTVIANSLATARSLGEQTKSRVIYNGFDQSGFPNRRLKHFHEELSLAPDVKTVAVLGALAEWKGQLQFVRMAKRLAMSGSNAHFLIIGDEIYDTKGDSGFKEKLKNEIEVLGLSGCVHLIGFMKDAVKALQSIDVLVHTSIRPEPFGRVIVEAMACGTPVVASAAGGVLEIIDHGKNGLLYAGGDVAEMAAAVQRILLDGELATTLSENAHADFTRRFSLNGHLSEVLSVYASLSKTA